MRPRITGELRMTVHGHPQLSGARHHCGQLPPSGSHADLVDRTTHDFARMMAAAPGWDRIPTLSGAAYALVLEDSPIAAALTERRYWTALGTDDGYVLLRAAT